MWWCCEESFGSKHKKEKHFFSYMRIYVHIHEKELFPVKPKPYYHRQLITCVTAGHSSPLRKESKMLEMKVRLRI